ncbi:hypothetical protein CFAM422_004469 [Trichoderma lentiforme]|uniref:Uncharacterized protein n=1 Tax=Trichoderma lentiforme TaxID=1567552 RepID=A0A9P5CFH3_9HYPO|nr:hypothetical protein CFAM422_004469 [Trichoderma lentiforme]
MTRTRKWTTVVSVRYTTDTNTGWLAVYHQVIVAQWQRLAVLRTLAGTDKVVYEYLSYRVYGELIGLAYTLAYTLATVGFNP